MWDQRSLGGGDGIFICSQVAVKRKFKPVNWEATSEKLCSLSCSHRSADIPLMRGKDRLCSQPFRENLCPANSCRLTVLTEEVNEENHVEDIGISFHTLGMKAMIRAILTAICSTSKTNGLKTHTQHEGTSLRCRLLAIRNRISARGGF